VEIFGSGETLTLQAVGALRLVGDDTPPVGYMSALARRMVVIRWNSNRLKIAFRRSA